MESMFRLLPWSAIDLISTHQGCSKRYGFIYVNRDEFDLKDLRRIRKKAFTGIKPDCYKRRNTRLNKERGCSDDL
ncbi:family 1 glycosylhydrolase [Bacillus licheniformis]|nr:family 1 glycosylhydrolase [Bacillus licheniformis]